MGQIDDINPPRWFLTNDQFIRLVNEKERGNLICNDKIYLILFGSRFLQKSFIHFIELLSYLSKKVVINIILLLLW